MSVNRGGSNWWVDSQPGPSSPGGATVGGGGYGAAVVQYRDQLDARRSMAGQESQYPDGYLGTIIDRHQDKVLAEVQTRLTDRSYQRGVHLGSKIGQRQYQWDAAVNPLAGLQRQAETAVMDPEGKILTARFAPSLDPVERLAHMGKTAGMSAPQMDAVARQYGVDPGKNPVVVSPNVRDHLQKMLPRYAV
jgi:hypothetical protein